MLIVVMMVMVMLTSQMVKRKAPQPRNMTSDAIAPKSIIRLPEDHDHHYHDHDYHYHELWSSLSDIMINDDQPILQWNWGHGIVWFNQLLLPADHIVMLVNIVIMLINIVIMFVNILIIFVNIGHIGKVKQQDWNQTSKYVLFNVFGGRVKKATLYILIH